MMSPIEILEETRRFYESQFDDEFDAEEAIELLVTQE